ncbi:hypothetical protein C2G38_849177 [Gigaspora rosea]|uniref:Uncharacterized protein n=1 Tax=Gigaspora rosea TaxID=44941 RepID=A0A397VR40_9GLOM|nr:hypothetical protein C2G38_849177 [Gigaspora rosea]
MLSSMWIFVGFWGFLSCFIGSGNCRDMALGFFRFFVTWNRHQVLVKSPLSMLSSMWIFVGFWVLLMFVACFVTWN